MPNKCAVAGCKSGYHSKSETFGACILTLNTLADIPKYLIEKHGFHYVLLGKLQSDPLEGRFGQYRQVNGASYIVTVRQILQAEKKLRILSLLQQKVIEDAANEATLEILAKEEASAELKSEDVTWLVDSLEFMEERMSEADETLVYYAAGYLGRSVVRSRKCDKCRVLLISDSVPSESDGSGDFDQNVTKLFDIVSRGGLTHPSPINFSICLIIYNYFHQICSDKTLSSEFLQKERHMHLFVEAITVKTSAILPVLTDALCEGNHFCFNILAKKMFNLFSRNVLKRLNDTSFVSPNCSGRKVRKLQSESSK